MKRHVFAAAAALALGSALTLGTALAAGKIGGASGDIDLAGALAGGVTDSHAALPSDALQAGSKPGVITGGADHAGLGFEPATLAAGKMGGISGGIDLAGGLAGGVIDSHAALPSDALQAGSKPGIISGADHAGLGFKPATLAAGKMGGISGGIDLAGGLAGGVIDSHAALGSDALQAGSKPSIISGADHAGLGFEPATLAAGKMGGISGGIDLAGGLAGGVIDSHAALGSDALQAGRKPSVGSLAGGMGGGVRDDYAGGKSGVGDGADRVARMPERCGYQRGDA